MQKSPPHSLQHHASRNRREFLKFSSRLPSTDSLRICQTREGISFYPPLHSIILTIFQNAKNRRKKTGNLFLISCLGMPFLCSGGYSVFNWLQFYKSEFHSLIRKPCSDSQSTKQVSNATASTSSQFSIISFPLHLIMGTRSLSQTI